MLMVCDHLVNVIVIYTVMLAGNSGEERSLTNTIQ